MTRYTRDPYWLTARRAGTCAKCGDAFAAGARIFWFPNGRAAYSGTCAEDAAARFSTEAADEAAYGGGY